MGDGKKIRTWIVEGNSFFRTGLASILTGSGRFVVTCDAPSLPEVIETSKDIAPDLLIVAFGSGCQEVPEEIANLRKRWPETMIVGLTDEDSPVLMADCLVKGISGFLSTKARPSTILQSLVLVSEGEPVYPATTMAEILKFAMPPAGYVHAAEDGERNACLTDREKDILHMLTNGESNKAIARHIGITEATIKVHLRSLLRKLNAANRTQAAIWALNNGYTHRQGRYPMM